MLEEGLAPARARLLDHAIYTMVDSEARLRCFMEHHIFAVWDFMSLVKALQRELTSVTLPWTPTRSTHARRLINEIVLAEESDDDGRDGYLSHFELYLAAMDDLGADTGPARALCAFLGCGVPLAEAIASAAIPEPARVFVTETFELLTRGVAHEIAAAFTFGREDVIPEMFRRFVTTLAHAAPQRFSRLRYYLDRHITIDANDHGPKARRLVEEMCGTDPARWVAATQAAAHALDGRMRLWDGVAVALQAR
jgi:hypothetical protein